MQPTVHLELPSGDRVALGHGAIIGRLWTADLPLNDGRISEAHAMVSLRGRDLHLLALRGRFQVRGRVLADVILRPGTTITFATGLDVHVVEVRVPRAVLALEAPGIAAQVLPGVASLYGGPRPRLVAGWHADADDWVWPTGESWMRGGDPPRRLDAGDRWEVGGSTFVAVERRLEGTEATRIEPAYATPCTITARFDTVHIARAGEPVVVITGHMARVLSELATLRAPVAWEALAQQLWSDDDRHLLRHRWDVLLLRFRRKLRDHHLRADLVRADGSGLIELVLGPEDLLVDET